MGGVTEIEFTSNMQVELVEASGSDEMICKAARVSTLGAESIDSTESAGLINFLLSNRHGSPFEHGMMTFRISAPIFVWREFMRHRIGFSYNEESGRYKKLEPKFYIPHEWRPLQQVGKAGAYEFVKGTEEQIRATRDQLEGSCVVAWEAYEALLEKGVAKEVARVCLPVNTFSTAYVTCNPRSMMSFLSLRRKVDSATFKSYPMWEIDKVATLMEMEFNNLYPLTFHAFRVNGRVSP